MLLAKPQVICFDWDNTLVNTNPITLESLNELFKKKNKPLITFEDLEIINGYNFEDYFKSVFGDEYSSVMSEYRDIYEKHSKKLDLLPGAIDTIKRLHQLNVPMLIISNKYGNLVRAEAEKFGVINYFKAIVGPDDASYAKPDIRMFEYAMRITGLENIPGGPDSRWFFGDSIVDIAFARVIYSGLFFLGSDRYDVSGLKCTKLKSHADFSDIEIEK